MGLSCVLSFIGSTQSEAFLRRNIKLEHSGAREKAKPQEVAFAGLGCLHLHHHPFQAAKVM